MTDRITLVKISTDDRSVSFNPAQIVTFRAAVAGALARQAAEVLGPSGCEVLACAPQFQLTVGFETVEGWFIQFDNVSSFGLDVVVGYQLVEDDEATGYMVTVTIDYVIEGESAYSTHDPLT